MLERASIRRAACSVAVGTVVFSSSFASAQSQLTFQKANSISLSSLFAADTGWGTNPLSVAADDAGNAYVGGFNSSGAAANIGVVKISDVLTGTPTLAGIAGSQFNSPASRGIDALGSVNGDLFVAHDAGNAAASFIQRLTSTGTEAWKTFSPGGQRPMAMAIDPVADVTTSPGTPLPGVAFLASGQGRRLGLNLADGSLDYTISGGAKPGGIINTNPSVGTAWRALAFDEVGNIIVAEEDGVGVGLRVNENRWSNLDGVTLDSTTRSLLKNTPLNNVGNGVALLTGAADDELLVMSPRITGNGQGGTVTLTPHAGSPTEVDSRNVQIRLLNGDTGYLSQTQLTGAEDGIGNAYTGEVKNFAVGKDAAGQPVLYVVDYVSRRLDVYTIEPKWNADADGTWTAGTNWATGVAPDSRITNATFGDAITAARTVTLDSSRTVKQLKFDSDHAYTLSAAGGATITLAAPTNDAHPAYISVLRGDHVVNAPITLGSNARFDVAAGASVAVGAVDGPGRGITKRGQGTFTAAHVRASTLVLAEGQTKIAPNGAESGMSRVGTLTLEGGTLDLTNNGLIVDYADASPYADLEAAILAGTITTSEPGDNRVLGIVEYGDVAGPTFSDPGLTIDDTSVLIRYTLKGDSNLDKVVNFDDLLTLAQNYNTTSGAIYAQGDSNYSGSVDFDDLLALAQNYNSSLLLDGAGLGTADFAADLVLAQSLVPEPAALGLLAFAGLGLRRRRR